MSGPSLPHISFPRAQAALQAGDLAFILAHAGQISMNLEFEIGVCRLIAEQSPERLEAVSAQWLVGFAQHLAALCEERGQTV